MAQQKKTSIEKLSSDDGTEACDVAPISSDRGFEVEPTIVLRKEKKGVNHNESEDTCLGTN